MNTENKAKLVISQLLGESPDGRPPGMPGGRQPRRPQNNNAAKYAWSQFVAWLNTQTAEGTTTGEGDPDRFADEGITPKFSWENRWDDGDGEGEGVTVWVDDDLQVIGEWSANCQWTPSVGPIPLLVGDQLNPELKKHFSLKDPNDPNGKRNQMGKEWWGFPTPYDTNGE